MRIVPEQARFFKEKIKAVMPMAAVYLFGSRADNRLKGGDIDILVVGERILSTQEKREIIESADDLLNIRELRNQIAHEYQESALNALYIEVLRYTPEIQNMTESLKKYLQSIFQRGA